MFVDSSALVAILLGQAGARGLADRIEQANTGACMTSPLAVFEAALAVARTRAASVEQARSAVMAFLDAAAIRVAPVDGETARLSLAAHERYGKGRHPARLNFGDCFAYAMAVQHRVPLLYTGGDFAHTDLA